MNTTRAMVLISNDPASMQAGAGELYKGIQEALQSHGLAKEVEVAWVSDLGSHDAVPFAIVYPEAVVYGPLKAQDAGRLVESHLVNGQVLAELLAPEQELTGPLASLRTRRGSLPVEKRIVLERVGVIDPENIEDYLSHDGYQALKKALAELTPAQIIDEISKSGLQGRGGAGFPVGRKWSFVAGAQGQPKYVICNADESEPGTFKDRMILEGDPHAVIEAMTIAGYAVGAHEGYIYIRGEYAQASARFERALQQALQHGLLGENILQSGFDFQIHIHSGAGAYICGEETALIESIEGKRGEPRARPPYPPTQGLWGKPTLVNNVETLANIPPILRRGAEWYRTYGTPSSPGTKVFMMLGNVNRPGLIEAPMGITLREILTIYAQGMKNNSSLKLIQSGGSSGAIVPASLQDTPLDFEAFRKTGVSLGSGALLFCDENTCVVDLAKVIMQFFRFESCGKCTPCRIGTQRSYEILARISEGGGSLPDLDELQKLGTLMEQLSNCGLGQTAWVATRDILKHFRAEVEAHIRLGVCPTGVCSMVPETSPENLVAA